MKAFVITLSNIQSSLESGTQVIKDLKSFGVDANLFEGTYGNDAEIQFQKENRMLHPSLVDSPNNRKISSPGVKGCFDSHYRLWKHCLNTQESIMIFEDDVVLRRSFVPIEFTDILVLSINYDWKLLNCLKTYLEDDHDITEVVKYDTRVMPGASGYVITPNAAKKLLAAYNNTFMPADWAINKDICEIKIHPCLMGRSKMLDEKESLTRSKMWLK